MEKINKQNYEAYLLDFIEGNLSAEEQHDLFVFLAEHPELKAEFEGGFDEVILVPDGQAFTDKESLKITGEDALTVVNVETRMIECVEGLLNEAKEKELAEFVKHHALEKTWAAYQATRLKPDFAEVFENKQRLKVGDGKVIPLYVRIAAVAAVAVVLFGAGINYLLSGGQSTPQLAGSISSGLSGNFSGDSGMGARPYLADESPADPADDRNATVNGSSPVGHRPGTVPVEPSEKGPDNLVQVDTIRSVPGYDGIDGLPQDDELVRGPGADTLPGNSADPVVTGDVIASSGVRSEQPYKLITDVASSVINKEVYFSRDKDLRSEEYVAYQFKLGSFEFERKNQSSCNFPFAVPSYQQPEGTVRLTRP